MALYVGNQKVCPIIKSEIDWSKINYTNYIDYLPVPCVSDGYLSNFTSGTAYYCPKTNINNKYTDCVDFSQPFELSVEFVPPTTSGGAVFGNALGSRYYSSPSCEVRNTGTTSIWTAVSTDGSSWTNQFSFNWEEVPILQQKHYIIKHIWDGTDYTVSVQYDNVIASKTQTLSANPYYSTTINSYQTAFTFGTCAGDSNLRFNDGKIYLPNTYIKQNGVLVWGNEGKYISHIGYPYIIVGSLVDNNGIISGFSGGNYVKEPDSIKASSSSSAQFITAFTLNSYVNNDDQHIFGNSGSGSSLNNIHINTSGYIQGWNGTSTALQSPSFKPVLGTKYIIVETLTTSRYSDAYIIEDNNYSLDTLPALNSGQWTTLWSNYYQGSMFDNVCMWGANNNQYLRGSIDMNLCAIKQDNTYIWTGTVI